VLSWDIDANWQYDPNLKTEIEVRFIAEGKDATRVELEHRKLDRYGARRDEMRHIFETEGDWVVSSRCLQLALLRRQVHDDRHATAHHALPVSAQIRDSEPQPVLLQARNVATHRASALRDHRDARSSQGAKRKLPFIEDSGVRIADTSIIIDHLKRTRDVDPDARLDGSQRATALLVQRTLEEHYAFVVAYTHLVRNEGVRHTRARFDSVPSIVRPLSFTRCRNKSKICSGSRASCAMRNRDT